MLKEYIIFEDSVHAQVFLVQAEDESAARNLYLEREYGYVRQPDGTYRSGPFDYDNLESFFSAYGITRHDNGIYSDTDGGTFQSWKDVKNFYGIEVQDDGVVATYGKSYPNSLEAVRGILGHHHIEIASCSIDPLIAFQTLFVSKDKWDYVELDAPEDLKSDIISQHLWQSERYKSLGQLHDAVAELKRALKLADSRKDRLYVHEKLAWLLKTLQQFQASSRHYRQALRLATEFDNEPWIRYRLAEVYEDMKQSTKALWHYKRVFLEDLDDEDGEKITRRIAELESANSTAKIA